MNKIDIESINQMGDKILECQSMIKERFMVEGKRLDNWEIIRGYLTTDEKFDDEIRYFIEFWVKSEKANVCNQRRYYEVDPATIQPVAVKVKNIDKCGKSFGKQTDCGNCPNCDWTVASAKNYPYDLENNDYCGHCGQRLAW